MPKLDDLLVSFGEYEPTAAMNRPLLPICVEGEWFTLDAPLVVEVLGKQPWLPIPGATSRSPGIVSWQGRAIALVDLAGALEMPPSSPDKPRDRLVVLRVGPSTLAIPADQVREVHEVDEESLRPPHAVRARYTRAETEVSGRLMPLLDVGELISEISRELKSGAAQ